MSLFDPIYLFFGGPTLAKTCDSVRAVCSFRIEIELSIGASIIWGLVDDRSYHPEILKMASHFYLPIASSMEGFVALGERGSHLQEGRASGMMGLKRFATTKKLFCCMIKHCLRYPITLPTKQLDQNESLFPDVARRAVVTISQS